MAVVNAARSSLVVVTARLSESTVTVTAVLMVDVCEPTVVECSLIMTVTVTDRLLHFSINPLNPV
jgi:hypothetical protein